MAIGFLLGIIFIMTQQMLILFTIFVERSNSNASTQTLAVTQSQQAMASFAWFLFMVYGIFGTMLYIFRNDLITPGTLLAVNSTFFEQFVLALVLFNVMSFV